MPAGVKFQMSEVF